MNEGKEVTVSVDQTRYLRSEREDSIDKSSELGSIQVVLCLCRVVIAVKLEWEMDRNKFSVHKISRCNLRRRFFNYYDYFILLTC